MERSSRVSVVVPVYNREQFVVAAIRSALDQTFPAAEIVVVDDGSTDRSAALVAGIKNPAVKLIRQPNAGIGAARNTGIRHASGDWIAFLDSDDLWEPAKLALQLACADREPDADLIFGHCIQFRDAAGENGESRTIEGKPVEGWIALTMLAKRCALDVVGPFPTDTRVGEFIDWFHRARIAGLNVHMMPEVLARRRIHDSNTVRTEAPAEYLMVLRRAIKRHRQRKAAAGGRTGRSSP